VPEQAFTVSNSFPAAAPVPPWKRLLDLACIAISLPILVPLMTLIALVIKLLSRGPVIFKQERLGYLGQPFNCLKFRTMHVDAAQRTHQSHVKDLIQSGKPMIKFEDLESDPRLIPLAGLLRATGLDELPQIFNVFRGEMSLVGPRPCLPYEYDNYLPWQKRRFNSLPGITGLWQVSGKNKTTFNEMIQLDISYLSHRSLWLDLKIIFKTPPVLVLQLFGLLKKHARKTNHGSPIRS